MRDRLEKLFRVFAEAGRAEDGRATIQALADDADVDTDVLTPKYVQTRRYRPETLERITRAAAGLLGLDETRLARWLAGKSEPRTEQQIDQMLRLRKCAACGEWFDRDHIDPTLCRCQCCLRSPAQNQWLQEVEAKLPAAPPRLRQAWEAAKAQRLAINYIRLAALAKMSMPTFRRTWVDSGLPARPIPGRPRLTTRIVSHIGGRRRRSPASRRRYGDGEGQLVLCLAEAA